MTTGLQVGQWARPIVDLATGRPTREFYNFLEKLQVRVGGDTAPTNTELAAGGAGNTAAIDQLTTVVTLIGATDGHEETIQPVTGDGVTDNADVVASFVGPAGSLVGAGGVRARIKTQGTYHLSALQDVHPSISLDFGSRGGILLQPDADLPATTPEGSQAALLRVVRDSPDSAGTLAWGWSISGVNLDARGVTLANQVHGIRVPNADPSKNPLDPDPAFAGNKDYVAGCYAYGDIIGFTGSGLLAEATNGRLDVHSFRCLNNGLNGFDLGGNDIVMSGHWAAGGNGLFGVKVGNASGFFATTGNIWGLSNARSLTCGAMWINQRKLFGVGFSEFNDWVRLDGGNSFWRGGVMALNCMAPFDDLFNQALVVAGVPVKGYDGLMIDVGRTNPLSPAGGDSRLQAFQGITDYQSVNFIGQQYFRTTKVNFATPNNIGGALDGSQGTAPQYFIDASSNAMVNSIDTTCSAPDVKPWVNTDVDGYGYIDSAGDPTPYKAHGGATVNYTFMDSYRGLFRVGCKGATHSHIALGLAEVDEIDTDYAIELGDRTLPAGVAYRNILRGFWELDNGVQYTDGAVTRNSFSHATDPDPLAVTVKAGIRMRRIVLTNAAFSQVTVTLPTDMNAHQPLRVFISGQDATSLLWAVSGAGTINASSVALPASSLRGWTIVDLWYDHATNEWDCVGVWTPPIADQAAKVGSGAAVALTSATIANLASITLGPGLWNVSGSTIFTAGGANTTPSMVKAALSSANNTIPAVDATAYASRGVNQGIVAATTDFETLTMSGDRISVAAGATTTVYLNARCNYTGAGAAVSAWGALRAVPANNG